MGCDIHLHTEVKIDGKWEHMGHPHIDRCYHVFALMAGVRNSEGIIPIAEPRGLPDGMSLITELHAKQWQGDGHSYSWLSGEEIDILEERWEAYNKLYSNDYWYIGKEIGYVFGSGWNVKKYGHELVEDTRLVFWFDN